MVRELFYFVWAVGLFGGFYVCDLRIDGLFVVCGLWAIVVLYCCVVCRLCMSGWFPLGG